MGCYPKFKILILFSLFLIFGFQGCSSNGGGGTQMPPAQGDFVQDEVNVKFGGDAPRPLIDQLISDCGTEVIMETSFILDSLSVQLPDDIFSPIRNFFELRILDPEQTVQETLTCFESRPDIVEFSEPNFIGMPVEHQSDNYPNDPLFIAGNQWSLLNAGQNDPPPGGNMGTIDADIDVIQSWDLIHSDCSDAIVAIFDTGADLDHPDLDGNLWINPGEVPGDGIDNEGNGFIDDINGFDFTQSFPLAGGITDLGGDGPEDTLPAGNFGGHGTHVAGIIGAEGNNGIDITGICWTARLMIIRIGNPGTNNGRLLFSALYTAIQKIGFGQEMRVINMSYGNFGFFANNTLALFYNLTNAVDTLFVKASANNNQDLDLPANPEYPCNAPARTANVICVAASNNTDTLATGPGFNAGSNFGTTAVDIAAPGENIQSLFLAGGTAVLSGTSMAAPHVSGIAALAFDLFPGKTVQDVKNDILFGSVGPQPASGADIIKTMSANTIFGEVISDGRLRWPYTGDMGDAPPPYDTVAALFGGALHWDLGNEFLGPDSTPEVDAVTPPPLDQDPLANIIPFVNQDLADHPSGFGQGNFVFTPPPPWPPGAAVAVDYDVCSDYFGIIDADGGRYQSDYDRAIYVNAFFDLNLNGTFEPDELLLEDIITPPPALAPLPKPANPNVTVNLQPVLLAPLNPPVFPPNRLCEPITSIFIVPPPGGTPAWIRFRLDYGEDMEINNPDPVFRSDNIFPNVQHLHWARHGEVEDFFPIELDIFPESIARVDIVNTQTLQLLDSIELSGPTEVTVDIGNVRDSDENNLDQVQTEIVQMELTGTSSQFGTVILRVRGSDKSPFQRSIGEIEETANNTPGVLDLPPFTETGTADSFFDVFFEIELPDALPGMQLLHNDAPKRMETTITHKPPAENETYESPEVIPLLDESDNQTGFGIGATLHIPDPRPLEVIVPPEDEIGF